jgi:hypothetical protein
MQEDNRILVVDGRWYNLHRVEYGWSPAKILVTSME